MPKSGNFRLQEVYFGLVRRSNAQSARHFDHAAQVRRQMLFGSAHQNILGGLQPQSLLERNTLDENIGSPCRDDRPAIWFLRIDLARTKPRPIILCIPERSILDNFWTSIEASCCSLDGAVFESRTEAGKNLKKTIKYLPALVRQALGNRACPRPFFSSRYWPLVQKDRIFWTPVFERSVMLK